MGSSSASPLVSVIIPVYNGANYLREAVESVFAQTYAPIEIVLVDDGSQDNTWEIIQSFGERVCAIHQENKGVAGALNTGIRNSRGELIAWLSHDDIFLPEKIALQVEFLTTHPEYGACYTDFEIIDAHGGFLSIYHAPWYSSRDLPRSFLRDMHINGSTILVRKDCFDKASEFDERLAHTQDLEMWLRLSEHAEFGHLPKALIKFRSHPDQGSLKFAFQIQEEQSLFSELFERLGPNRFFPDLDRISNPEQLLAEGRLRFADELRRHRRWYRFARDQYRISDQARPSIEARWKAFTAQVALGLWGDESESLILGKQARILLSLGRRSDARRLSGSLLRKHPLRVDALLIWLASWVSPQILRPVKQLKRRLNT